MCLARSTPHTGSSGAQGLWSEFTAKPQLAAPKGSTGPPGLSEASGPVCLPAGAAAAGVNLGRPSRGRVRVLMSSRFAKASTANKQLRVGTDYGDGDSATFCKGSCTWV